MLFGDQYGSVHFDVVSSGPGSGLILKQSRQARESIVSAPEPEQKPKPKRKKKNVRKTKNKK